MPGLTADERHVLQGMTVGRSVRPGAHRARIQNDLVRKGYARFEDAPYGGGRCVITEEGRAALAPSPP